jgi:hypothetical protein
MQKLIYAFWQPDRDAAALRDALVGELGPQLKRQSGVHGVQVNVTDEHFTGPGLPPLFRTQPALQGIINIWVDTSFTRQPLEQLIARHVAGFHGYSVVDSQPIVNTKQPPVPGRRLDALSQIVFIEKPAAMAHRDWLTTWLELHTQIAIDTQSTFQYVQNAVLRPLTPGAPEYHGIIEECFPPAAFTDQAVFYDAVGDEPKLQSHFKQMMDSCARFIDRERLDIIYTSQYVI